MSELELLRQEIDGVDRALVDLFLQRMDIAQRVGEYKLRQGIPVLDAAREQVVLESKRALAPSEETAREVGTLFEALMGISRARQQRRLGNQTAEVPPMAANHGLRIIYQGEAGAYTEEAARHYFGETAQIGPTPRWSDVFEALTGGSADYGVLPIENSTTGAITQVYDLLAAGNVAIVGEVIVNVRHCLMGVSGATVEGLGEVFSHPQGFFQCGAYLAGQAFVCTEMGNTALAAQHVAKFGDKTKAAIGSPRAAEVYGLEILAESINDAQYNQTRFLVVQAEERAAYGPEADKVSMLFTLPHRSGTLNQVMGIFARYGLNLLKLESRPLADRPWEYLFFVDFSANLSEENAKLALAELTACALQVQVLGNYKGVTQ